MSDPGIRAPMKPMRHSMKPGPGNHYQGRVDTAISSVLRLAL